MLEDSQLQNLGRPLSKEMLLDSSGATPNHDVSTTDAFNDSNIMNNTS